MNIFDLKFGLALGIKALFELFSAERSGAEKASAESPTLFF